MSPFFTCGKIRLLDVPHAVEVATEVWNDDCYRIGDIPMGSIVLDIGAFYGEFGLICRLNKDCRVIAFEPSATNYEIAKLNIRVNGLEKDKLFILEHCAIRGTNGVQLFQYNPEHPAGSSICDGDTYSEEVVCWSISDAVEVAMELFGSDRPVVVKMDCEGSERSIFESNPEWLLSVSIVTMEFHNHDGDFYADILEKNGFDVEITGGGPKPRPKWDKSIGGGLLFAKKRSK
jgi:FkbM family methyltransferase